MAPFRPTNVNKRSYPGNANVVGPTVATILGFSTTTCCSSTNVCGACVNVTFGLGCRYGGGCACPCCDVCCSCPCTVCTPTVPSGMWSSFEQYEASTRNAWDKITSSSGAATCLSCTNVGYACSGAGFVDYKGFFICCGPSTTKWFVAPSCTQVSRTGGLRADAVTVANSCMGSCGWFVPSCGQLQNPGYCCRTYWDSYVSAAYWSNTDIPPGYAAWMVDFNNGNACHRANPYCVFCVRAFRCTAS